MVVARELTKIHEEFLRGTVADVRAQLASRERIRGEIVLLIEARLAATEPAANSVAERIRELIESEGLPQNDALKQVARERALSKSAVYREWQRSKK